MISYEKNIERIYYKKEQYERTVGMIGFTDKSKDIKVGILA